MIDAVHPTVQAGQDMAALSIGVVHDHVEDRHSVQPRIIRMDQRHLAAGVIKGADHREISGRNGFGRPQVHQFGVAVRSVGIVGIGLLNPKLKHTGSGRAISNDRVRHNVPAQRGRDREGAELPAGQRAVRKIPQRLLAGDGLIDAGNAVATPLCLADEGRIAGRTDPTVNLQFTGAQSLEACVGFGHGSESSPAASGPPRR